jgi:RecA/RadA recombinase
MAKVKAKETDDESKPGLFSSDHESKPKKEKDLLANLISISGNKFADIAENGIESGDITSFIDTGSLALNAMLSGSILDGAPDNKIIVLAGEEATGKSFFVLSMVQTFLQTRTKGIVVLFETEGGLTKNMLVDRGMDTKRIAETVEETNTQAVKMIDYYLDQTEKYRKDNPMIMVLDSLGMLSTLKETTDTATGSEKKDMTRAALVKKFFRTMTLKLSRAGVAFLVTNHTYDETGPFGKRVMSGGCLVDGTMIRVPNGYKNISDINIGDLVETLFGIKKVTETFQFEKDTYKLSLEDGTIIECSGEHRFLLNGIWISVKDLFELVNMGQDINISSIFEGDPDVYRKQVHKNLLQNCDEGQ